MLHCPHCGLLDAPLESGVCARCGRHPLAAPAPAPAPAEEASLAAIALYPLGTVKLAVMAVTTLGLYNIFWFYRNLRLRRELRGRDISPFWRSLFAPLFAYSLFDEVRGEAADRGAAASWAPGWLALLFFVLGASARLPDPYWLVSVLAFVPLIDVQRTINQANARCPVPLEEDRRLTPLNLLGVAVGMVMLLLLAAGFMLPPEAPQ